MVCVPLFWSDIMLFFDKGDIATDEKRQRKDYLIILSLVCVVFTFVAIIGDFFQIDFDCVFSVVSSIGLISN